MTAELVKYEPAGVSGLLSCSLSNEAVDADVKEGICVASCESIVSRRGVASLFLVRLLIGSPVKGFILTESSGAAGAEAVSSDMDEPRVLGRRG